MDFIRFHHKTEWNFIRKFDLKCNINEFSWHFACFMLINFQNVRSFRAFQYFLTSFTFLFLLFPFLTQLSPLPIYRFLSFPIYWFTSLFSHFVSNSGLQTHRILHLHSKVSFQVKLNQLPSPHTRFKSLFVFASQKLVNCLKFFFAALNCHNNLQAYWIKRHKTRSVMIKISCLFSMFRSFSDVYIPFHLRKSTFIKLIFGLTFARIYFSV